MVLSAEQPAVLSAARVRELVHKYDVAGPRYTSYPTVPVWTDAFGPAEARGALTDAARAADDPLALYVHLPFCPERCLFCACNTMVTKTRWLLDRYLETLEQEIEIVGGLLAGRRRAAQLHLGGGTPTYLSIEQLGRLFELIGRHFDLEPGGELSVEADPLECSEEQLEALVARGMNRISLGVQDLDPKVQETVNRVQPLAVTEKLVTAARKLGIEAINFDLIYGLPHQTVSSVEATIAEVMTLRPTRIALYSFAFVPWLKPHQKVLPVDSMPHGDAKFALFERAREMLLGDGYVQIGMDHFALADDELAVAQRAGKLHRNFMGYTVQDSEDLVAFGSSAISYVAGRFYQNDPHLRGYPEPLKTGELPIVRGHQRTKEDHLRGYVISEIMCNLALDLEEVSRRFDVDAAGHFAEEIERLSPLGADGLLSFDGRRLNVSETGKLFLRNIAMCFDAHLSGDSTSGKPTFSRTI